MKTHLDRVNIVGDDNELCLLLFNKGGDLVDSLLDNQGLLGEDGILASSLVFSKLLQAELTGDL